MITHNGKNYLTPREAARALVIHLSTVYSWCKHQQVELLDPEVLQEDVVSKYLIEEESLYNRHHHVYLETS